MMPSNKFILSHPLLFQPSIFPTNRVFSNESSLCIRWPKYCSYSFSFSISPSNVYLGLISFRRDWLDLLAVKGTLKSLLQPRIQHVQEIHNNTFEPCCRSKTPRKRKMLAPFIPEITVWWPEEAQQEAR